MLVVLGQQRRPPGPQDVFGMVVVQLAVRVFPVAGPVVCPGAVRQTVPGGCGPDSYKSAAWAGRLSGEPGSAPRPVGLGFRVSVCAGHVYRLGSCGSCWVPLYPIESSCDADASRTGFWPDEARIRGPAEGRADVHHSARSSWAGRRCAASRAGKKASTLGAASTLKAGAANRWVPLHVALAGIPVGTGRAGKSVSVLRVIVAPLPSPPE